MMIQPEPCSCYQKVTHRQDQNVRQHEIIMFGIITSCSCCINCIYIIINRIIVINHIIILMISRINALMISRINAIMLSRINTFMITFICSAFTHSQTTAL